MQNIVLPVAAGFGAVGATADSQDPSPTQNPSPTAIPASRLERSIDFYRRVLACRVIEDARDQTGPYVLMRAPGDRLLALAAGAVGREHPAPRLSLNVDDLDRIRADLWDLGVPLAEGSSEPQPRYSWHQSRSLMICDPDGHEIELFEPIICPVL